jgi:hypothetical protein
MSSPRARRRRGDLDAPEARFLAASARPFPADFLEDFPAAVLETEVRAGVFRFVLAVLVVAACFLAPFLLAGLTVAEEDFARARVLVDLELAEARLVERPFLVTLDFLCLDCFFAGFLFVMTA